jgi:hypothetical protein
MVKIIIRENKKSTKTMKWGNGKKRTIIINVHNEKINK